MDEWAALEMRYARKGIRGSNPLVSEKIFIDKDLKAGARRREAGPASPSLGGSRKNSVEFYV